MMGRYTEYLEGRADAIRVEDENYAEELLAIAQTFRSLDEALSGFIRAHGYEGQEDSAEKSAFVRTRFEEAQIPVPRGIKKWFAYGHHTISRPHAVQLCFAFHLSLEESEDFFRRVCLQRPLDCHDMEEAVCYFALRHALSYARTQEMIRALPDVQRTCVDLQGDVLYTKTIVSEIERITDAGQLMDFLRGNADQFAYHNATAYRYIQSLWEVISADEGLTRREARYLYGWKGERDAKGRSLLEIMENRKRTVWDIYLQILGLLEYDYDQKKRRYEPLFAFEADRSIQEVLKDNRLLHPLAVDKFPDRQGLEAILQGRRKHDEVVRKTLILLVFYQFWVNDALQKGYAEYHADEQAEARFHCIADRFLSDAGYPTLYAGNPFDWIFLYSAHDDSPLEALRFFMRELYLVKKDELEPKV